MTDNENTKPRVFTAEVMFKEALAQIKRDLEYKARDKSKEHKEINDLFEAKIEELEGDV